MSNTQETPAPTCPACNAPNLPTVATLTVGEHATYHDLPCCKCGKMFRAYVRVRVSYVNTVAVG